jgi:putative redox protein
MAEGDKEAVAVWKGGLAFEGAASSGLTVPMNSSAEGFSPMELVLVGLAGCTGMDVIDILRKKRQDVTGLEVRVAGSRAEDYPRKFTSIRIHFVVTGRQVDPEAVRRSIELSETKYCSVAATVSGTAKITTDFEIRAGA